MGKYYAKMSKLEKALHESHMKFNKKSKAAWLNVAIIVTQLLFIVAVVVSFLREIYAC